MTDETTDNFNRLDTEVYYETTLAPLLADVAKKATARDMPFVAVVEAPRGTVQFTGSAFRGASMPVIHFLAAMRAMGDLDALVLHVIEACDGAGIDLSNSLAANAVRGKAGRG